MADFVVAILSTLVILFVSYLFWKWHTQRNSLTNEEKNKRVASRADMLKSRLKHFEVKNDNSVPDDNSQNNLDETTKNRGFETRESAEESHDSKSNATSLQAIINSDSVHADSSTNLQTKSSEHTVQRANSRKWVRLSTSKTDSKLDPVTRPLTTLSELRAWMEGFDEQNVSSVPLRRVGGSLEQHPRTIVCHDMKGGYVQDR
jgi:hypothetical protein